ncbi:MAG: D-hexose-6-phosphate mutarotase [Pseudomonadota bacterium]
MSNTANIIAAKSDDGAQITATAHGGQILSWRPAGSDFDLLFVSPLTSFERGTAIRGGVPVVFPQFADRGGLAKHGFARNADWQSMPREDQSTKDGDPARIAFQLVDTDATRAVWPHAFALTLMAEARASALTLRLDVRNKGTAPVAFAAALHTYLAVNNAADCHVSGLEEVSFIDTAEGNAHRDPAGRVITFGGEIDRIYHAAPDVTLHDRDRRVLVATTGFQDTVVWNPGPSRAATIADLGNAHWSDFICIEAGAILSGVRLDAGESWTGTQSLTLMPRS